MDFSPILISLKTASLSIVITFFLGIACARLVIRLKHDKLKMVLDGILTLPLVLPPTVMGFFLLYVIGVKRPVGEFFLEYFGVILAFSWAATVIAAVASGGVLSFARGLGEFGATAMATGNMEDVYQYVAIIVVISFMVVVSMNYFTMRGSVYGKRKRRKEP